MGKSIEDVLPDPMYIQQFNRHNSENESHASMRVLIENQKPDFSHMQDSIRSAGLSIGTMQRYGNSRMRYSANNNGGKFGYSYTIDMKKTFWGHTRIEFDSKVTLRGEEDPDKEALLNRTGDLVGVISSYITRMNEPAIPEEFDNDKVLDA